MWSLLISLHTRSICKDGHVNHWCAVISVAVIAVTPQIRNTSEAVKVKHGLELKGSEVQNNMHFCAHRNSAYGCCLQSGEFLHGVPVNVVDYRAIK